MPFAKVIMHSAEMGKLLRGEGRYSGVRADLEARGQRVLAAAQASAPVVSGTYRDSLTMESDTTDRVAVRIGSDLEYAGEVEAATGNLSRALDSAG